MTSTWETSRVRSGSRGYHEQGSVMKANDIVSICNALVDILVRVEEKDIEDLKLTKGVMHLVESDRQRQILKHFADHHHSVELGGSAMNTIRTLAELKKKAIFAGMISDDHYGDMIRKRMDQLGIEAKLGLSHEPTGTCVVLITPDGERTMNTHLGASRLYTSAQVPFEAIKTSKIFHLSGYQWDSEAQKKAVKEALTKAKESGTVVSFDVADPFVVQRNQLDFVSLIEEYADIVFCNREEAKCLFGKTPDVAAQMISKAGAIAVIKLGAEGALLQQGDKTLRVDPVRTDVIDTTAAGDMFAAGFLYGYLGNRDLAVCGRMAATLASDVISRVGATVSNSALGEVSSM
jgi:sugar/nucleoside kinase (ribokinase family)